MSDAPRDQELLRLAIGLEAPAQQALLDGDTETATAGFSAAADAYRRSWEEAGPAAYGRLVGMLKATILAGRGLEDAAAYAEAAVADPGSPTSWYAAGLAAAIRGDADLTRRAADGMSSGSAAFGRAAAALRALADGDRTAFDAAVQAIRDDFAARDAHLTGVPIADTAEMFERLAALRSSPPGPPGP